MAAAFVAVGFRFARSRARGMAVAARDSTDDAARRFRGDRRPATQGVDAPTLHVFGSSYAGNAYAEIFARLGALGDIRIYALNPCREFWDDVDTSRRGALAGWAHRQDKVGDKLDESEDPFSLNGSSDPPALRLWGRPGREYIRLLNELSQCDFAPLFSDPVSGETPTVLEQLQQNILDRAARARACREWPGQAVGTANQFPRMSGNPARSRNCRERNLVDRSQQRKTCRRGQRRAHSLSRNRGADSRLGG